MQPWHEAAGKHRPAGEHLRKGRSSLNTSLIAVTLLLTIASAMGLGIALGYWLITAILHLMGHQPEAKPAPAEQPLAVGN